MQEMIFSLTLLIQSSTSFRIHLLKMTSILFEDMFVVEAKDALGKPFDLTSRFDCQVRFVFISLTPLFVILVFLLFFAFFILLFPFLSISLLLLFLFLSHSSLLFYFGLSTYLSDLFPTGRKLRDGLDHRYQHRHLSPEKQRQVHSCPRHFTALR